jgi:site-specific DNA-cytosine methylase
LRYASFFSGIGGFELALDAAGAERVYSCEIDEFCRSVFKARFGHEPQGRDINAVASRDIPDADLWVGGFPCQGLSVAGKRKGLADGRSGLFWQFVRLLEQKRPRWLLVENVPGLLSTCSCARCGRQCRDCAAPAGDEDELCQACGGERLGGRVLPEHRGTDFFVVLTALQRLGYGVQTRILDAQYLGVPQRRRRLFFAGHLGAPCPPEVLLEPQGGRWNTAEGGEAGKIAAGELARSIGGVGGGDDYGAGKGTPVTSKTKAHPVCFGTKPGFNDRGDGCDNLTESEGPQTACAVTAAAGHHGHSSPRGDAAENLVAGDVPIVSRDGVPKTAGGKVTDLRDGDPHPSVIGVPSQSVASTVQTSQKASRGQPRENLVVGTLQSCERGQGRKTPEVDHLVAPAMPGPAHTLSKGTGGGLGGRDGQDDYVVLSLTAHSKRHGHQMSSGQAAEGGHIIPVPAAPAMGFEPRYFGARADPGGRPSNTVGITNAKKGGDSAPHVLAPVAPCVTEIYGRTGGEGEASRLVQQPLFIHMADGGMNQKPVKRDGKADCLDTTGPGAIAFATQETPKGFTDKCPTLQVPSPSGGGQPHAVAIQEDGQNGVTMRDKGQSHPLRTNRRDAVAFDLHNKPKDKTGTLIGGHNGGGRNEINSPLVAFQPTGGTRDIQAGPTSPTIKVGSGIGIPSAPAIAFDTTQITSPHNRSNPKAGAPSPTLARRAHPPSVAASLSAGSTQGANAPGRRREDDENLVTADAHQPTMMVRRLTGTECERLQGGFDGWTDLCHQGKASNAVLRVVWETFGPENVSEALRERDASARVAIHLAQEALLQLYLRPEIQGFKGGMHSHLWKEACSEVVSHVRESLRGLRAQGQENRQAPQGREHAEQREGERGLPVRELPREAALEGGNADGESRAAKGADDAGRHRGKTRVRGGASSVRDHAPPSDRNLNALSACEAAEDDWTFCASGGSRIPPWVSMPTFRLGGCGHSVCGGEGSDSPRYRSLGNAVAICVIRWIADRLAAAAAEGADA